MWILRLNDMRMPKMEMLDIVGKAETLEALVSFLKSEMVEPYDDG